MHIAEYVLKKATTVQHRRAFGIKHKDVRTLHNNSVLARMGFTQSDTDLQNVSIGSTGNLHMSHNIFHRENVRIGPKYI